MKWPQHYTTGGNMNIDGEVKNMKFENLDPIVTFQVNIFVYFYYKSMKITNMYTCNRDIVYYIYH